MEQLPQTAKPAKMTRKNVDCDLPRDLPADCPVEITLPDIAACIKGRGLAHSVARRLECRFKTEIDYEAKTLTVTKQEK